MSPELKQRRKAEKKARIKRHRTQWLHNRDLLTKLPASHYDWVVAVAFYAALHAVETLFAEDGVQAVSNHGDRFAALRQNKSYDKIHDSYHQLYDLAYTTRYSAEPGRWIRFEDVESRVLNGLLLSIERSVARQLKMDEPAPLTLPKRDSDPQPAAKGATDA